jgi:hypothetical protein
MHFWKPQSKKLYTCHLHRTHKWTGSGIAQCYSAGLRAGWSGVRVPGGVGISSPHHRVQTGSGAHPASYTMGTRSSFPGGKAAGAWKLTTQLNLVPRSRLCGSIHPLLQYVFMVWCSVKKKSTGTTLPFTFTLTHNREAVSVRRRVCFLKKRISTKSGMRWQVYTKSSWANFLLICINSVKAYCACDSAIYLLSVKRLIAQNLAR